ncbi:HNH endonuclease family protein [Mycoplasma feriruminatoris]|uniref:HNH endonuclease n=1 Tax=Mycoplasma feriruminatoris TaxID=1179777 RepID=A0AAQ3DPF5_9MOLU|nr:HNH endonuclease family protein [Mycoplasma feriruminatoris]WFQ94937.1 HNH endonuclease [Mycoplasma feriruminatoris]
MGDKIIPTVEHIMPQNLSKDWIEDLKNITNNQEDINEKHKEHLNQIGNLVYINSDSNSSLGNDSFQIKKSSYKDSKWRILNGSYLDKLEKKNVMSISNYDNWDFEIIEKRTEVLSEYVYNIMEDLNFL